MKGSHCGSCWSYWGFVFLGKCLFLERGEGFTVSGCLHAVEYIDVFDLTVVDVFFEGLKILNVSFEELIVLVQKANKVAFARFAIYTVHEFFNLAGYKS
jgi:hypothetical protein